MGFDLNRANRSAYDSHLKGLSMGVKALDEQLE